MKTLKNKNMNAVLLINHLQLVFHYSFVFYFEDVLYVFVFSALSSLLLYSVWVDEVQYRLEENKDVLH